MKRRALLVSGGVKRDLMHPWHSNDLRAYYQLLIDAAGYAPADIRVCDGPGGARRLHGEAAIQVEPARRSHVLDAIGWLAELGDGDRAFLMVTDHGEPEGICLWGSGQYLTPGELEHTLAPSVADKVLVLGQCHGGKFGSMRIPRAVICCASEERAWPRPRPAPGVAPQYSEFLYQLAGALTGRYPDASPLPVHAGAPCPPGSLSIGEAFRFARDHDCWITGMRTRHELPRMFDAEGLADVLRL